MNIRKTAVIVIISIFAAFAVPEVSYAQDDSGSGINSGDHGLHLRAALGAGQVAWGYISHGSGSGDLGTGAGAAVNLAAMYNYSLLGLELNIMSGNIGDLEWTDKDNLEIERDYKSTGSGSYSVIDLKLGAKLFTEQGDMGYTYIFAGKRFWSTERDRDTIEVDGVKYSSSEKREAEGDGWIIGYRDFSTFGWDDGLAIVFQSGLFFGKAPVSEMSTDGVDDDYPEDESVSLGGELGAGVAFQNIGLSVVGGLRGEINATSFNDSSAPSGEESVFGFGNFVFFVEAGMMF